jgi:hypothetical protein
MKPAASLWFGLAACMAPLVALAADVDGTWVGRLNQSQLIFELKADGEKLTGTLFNSAATSATEIRDGTIKGNVLAFHVVRTVNNGEVKVAWTGQIAGDQIRFQRAATSNSAAADFVATREKK